MHLLFVCTGNMCRSPFAERLARQWLRAALGREADDVEVSSAGIDAPVGEPMEAKAAAELVRHGGEPAGFASCRFTSELAASADLVLTMTRRQRRAVLEASPRGLRRTFTLTEAADLAAAADLAGLADLPLHERAGELGRRLDAARARRPGVETDDIMDPIGRPTHVHRAVADQIADALVPVLSALVDGPRDGRQSPATDQHDRIRV